ncbi:Transportin-PC [Dichotomocladium elegans]|nr:Transportin-PC [Dichotomocladium elegans]
MTDHWYPQAKNLQDLLMLLGNANCPSNHDQLMVQQQLASFLRIPRYNSYFVHILTKMPEQDVNTRAIAGLTLKNNINAFFNEIPPAVLDHIKSCCMAAVENLNANDDDVDVEGNAVVRRTIGSVIAAIVTRGQPQNWLDMLHSLMNKLGSPDPTSVEMALDTLAKICEDNAEDLDEHFLDAIIPGFIALFNHSNPKFRTLSITAVNHFLTLRPSPLDRHMARYLNALYSITADTNDDVRQHVCRSLVAVLENWPEYLEPSMGRAIEYMVCCMDDDNEDLALGACDFWFEFGNANDPKLHRQLLPYMDVIIAALLRRMLYSEMELLALEEEDEEDDDTNHSFQNETLFPSQRGPFSALGGTQSRDDDDDDLVLEDEEFYSEWTPRKYSAACLEILSTIQGESVVAALLPLMNRYLFSQDWRERECGILALGAVASGARDELRPYLPQFPLVRYITCWALGQFSRWCVEQASVPEGRQLYFEPVLFSLLQCILDRNKRVQESACSALSILEEEANDTLVPYLEHILINITAAFNTYQHKNLLILYDALGTLAESVGSALKEPRCLFIILPPLIDRWNRLSDQDIGLFPLLECLSSVTAALGTGFAPYAEPVFTRCVKLVASSIYQDLLADQNPDDYTQPDADCIIVALGLLSGLVQGLGQMVDPLIANSNPPLLSLLAVCIHDPDAGVLQATNALIGDLAKACFGKLSVILPSILPELIQQITPDPEYHLACSNAVWALGEIALRWNATDMEHFVEPMLERLLPLLLNPNVPESLTINAVITVGRLGCVCPERLAFYLSEVLDPCLEMSLKMGEDNEKDTAFQGLCRVIQTNPNSISVDQFIFLLRIVANWKQPSQPLDHAFRQILEGYRNMLTMEQWLHAWNVMPGHTQQALSIRYSV